jgi:hypothetical protein
VENQQITSENGRRRVHKVGWFVHKGICKQNPLSFERGEPPLLPCKGIHKGSLTEVEQILVIVNLALTMPKLQRQPSPKSLKSPPKKTITTTTIIILHHHPIPILYNNNNKNKI